MNTWTKIFCVILTVAICGGCMEASAAKKGKRGGQKAEKAASGIPFTLAENYFVKNTVKPAEGLNWMTGIAQTQEEFDKIFGIARVMGEQKFLPEDYFKKGAVIYFILWGDTYWEFNVKSLVREDLDEKTLIVHYRRKGTKSESASYAVPLMICVDKSVVKDNPKIMMKEEGSKAK